MYKILIVEDDFGIASAVSEQAKAWGLEAKCVSDCRNVTAEFSGYEPHLGLGDISLPFHIGTYWCDEDRAVCLVWV